MLYTKCINIRAHTYGSCGTCRTENASVFLDAITHVLCKRTHIVRHDSCICCFEFAKKNSTPHLLNMSIDLRFLWVDYCRVGPPINADLCVRVCVFASLRRRLAEAMTTVRNITSSGVRSFAVVVAVSRVVGRVSVVCDGGDDTLSMHIHLRPVPLAAHAVAPCTTSHAPTTSAIWYVYYYFIRTASSDVPTCRACRRTADRAHHSPHATTPTKRIKSQTRTHSACVGAHSATSTMLCHSSLNSFINSLSSQLIRSVARVSAQVTSSRQHQRHRRRQRR